MRKVSLFDVLSHITIKKEKLGHSNPHFDGLKNTYCTFSREIKMQKCECNHKGLLYLRQILSVIYNLSIKFPLCYNALDFEFACNNFFKSKAVHPIT